MIVTRPRSGSQKRTSRFAHVDFPAPEQGDGGPVRDLQIDVRQRGPAPGVGERHPLEPDVGPVDAGRGQTSGVGHGGRLVEDLQHPPGAGPQRRELAREPHCAAHRAERGHDERDRGGPERQADLPRGDERHHRDEDGHRGERGERVGDGVLGAGGAGLGHPVAAQEAGAAGDAVDPGGEAGEHEQLAQALHPVHDVGVHHTELRTQRGAAGLAAPRGPHGQDDGREHPGHPDQAEHRVDRHERRGAHAPGEHGDRRTDPQVGEEGLERVDVAHRDGRQVSRAPSGDLPWGAAREPVEHLQPQVRLRLEREHVTELGVQPVPERRDQYRADDDRDGGSQPLSPGCGRPDQPAGGGARDDRACVLGDRPDQRDGQCGPPAAGAAQHRQQGCVVHRWSSSAKSSSVRVCAATSRAYVPPAASSSS